MPIRNPLVRIIARCKNYDGTQYQQPCATEAFAKVCMAGFRADPNVKLALAYYADDRGAIDAYIAPRPVISREQETEYAH